MKVLHVSMGFNYAVPPKGYGGEMVIYDQLKGFAELGIECDLLAPTGSHNPAGKVIDVGPTSTTFDTEKVLGEQLNIFLDKKDILSNYDVIHSHSSIGLPYVARYLGLPTPPIVQSFYGICTWEYVPPFILSQGTRPTDKFYFVALGDWHREHVKDVTGHDSKICHAAFDINRFHIGKNKHGTIVLGKLLPENGHLTAIQIAMARNVKLTVLGDSHGLNERYKDYVNVVRNAADAAGFTFIENCDNETKARLLADCETVLVPIMERRSSTVAVALEALASGCNVYTFNHSGLAEMGCQSIFDMLSPAYKVQSPEECRASIPDKHKPINVARRMHELYKNAISGEW